jgi:hypothetical protein
MVTSLSRRMFDLVKLMHKERKGGRIHDEI